MRNTWPIILIIFLLPCFVFSQPAWDSTYRPDIYYPRVTYFKKFAQSKKDVVFLGDSITFWADWSELFGSMRMKNRGIPGDISFGVLERLEETLKGKPAKLFVLIGINDLARNIPDEILIRNYERIIRRTKELSPSTRIYFQTMLPVNDSLNKMKNHTDKSGRIIYINERLKDMAAKEAIVLIDLHSYFTDENGKLKAGYTWDGVHLTAAGYEQWARVLKTGGYL